MSKTLKALRDLAIAASNQLINRFFVINRIPEMKEK